MNRPIKISGVSTTGGIVFRWLFRLFLPVIVCGLFAGLIKDSQDFLQIWLGIWIPFECWRIYLFLTAQKLIDSGDGFTVYNLFGSQDYKDDEIEMSSMICKPQISWFMGKYCNKRVYTIWIRGKKIVMTTRIYPGKPDPLADVIKRLELYLRERAKIDLNFGVSIHPDNHSWELNATTLHVFRKGAFADYPRNELIAIEIMCQRLLVWHLTKPEPILNIPQSSANASLLYSILHEEIHARNLEKNMAHPRNRVDDEGLNEGSEQRVASLTSI